MWPFHLSFFDLPFHCSCLTQGSDSSLKLRIDDLEPMLCGNLGAECFVLFVSGNGDAPPFLMAELEGCEDAFPVAPVLNLDPPSEVDEGYVSGGEVFRL